jgi:hypothetical protein
MQHLAKTFKTPSNPSVGKRILIVDYHQVILKVLTLTLGQKAYKELRLIDESWEGVCHYLAAPVHRPPPARPW